MSKSSQMTEATNINARTRPLPRKNFRILFMVQRLHLQPTLPLSLLTLSGEKARVAAATAAEWPESAPSPENSRKQQSTVGKLSSQCLSVSACVAFHSGASVPAQLAPGCTVLNTALRSPWEQLTASTRQFSISLVSLSPRPPSYKPEKRWGPGWGCHSSPPGSLSAQAVTQHRFS